MPTLAIISIEISANLNYHLSVIMNVLQIHQNVTYTLSSPLFFDKLSVFFITLFLLIFRY